ncbi:MAG: MATE family efflux transporter [Pseudomonadota bacterium]
MAEQKPAVFLQGNLMRHIIIMSSSASIGLVSIFLVDFVDLLFISMLGEAELAAAVGFAGTLLFFTFSVSIGLTIAASALAAQRIGQGDMDEARMITSSVIIFGLIVSIIVGSLFWFFAPTLVNWIGAKGETADYAVRYLRIVVTAMPISALGMMASGLLRAHGDARRAMTVTLSAGAVNAILDPILIFGLGLGLDGAAYASVASRIAMAATALYPIFKHYGGLARIGLPRFMTDLRPILAIAAPAMLTNVATPIGNSVVTRTIAEFGDSVVAGYAVAGRMTPLAFCVIFALSGAIGPIIGQNFGAKQFGRVRATLIKAVQFTAIYTLAAWMVLFALNGIISDQFQLTEDGRNLIFWFAAAVAPLFIFNGTLFISNAAFNNLRRPLFSTFLNWGKNTIGVVPFVIMGANIGGAPGVLIGQGIGGIVFGILGFWLAYRLVNKYEDGSADPDKGFKFPVLRRRTDDAPFSSPRG